MAVDVPADTGGNGSGMIASPTAPAHAAAGASGTVQQIIDFFRGKGLNDAAIAGILGNWKVESGFSTTSYNSGEGAHGLANWEGDRWPALENFAQAHGGSPFDLNVQLEFTWHELTTGYSNVLDQLRNTHNAWDAANIWNRQYEGSADYSNQRMQYAQSYFSSGFKNVSTVSITSSGGSGGGYTGSSGGASDSLSNQLGNAAGMLGLSTTAGAAHVFDSVPALKRIVDQAQANGWDLNRFLNAVEDSQWWKTHSQTARQMIVEQSNDPATWQRSLTNLMGTIDHLSRQLGLTSDRQENHDIAVNALLTGNDTNTDWLTTQLSNGVHFGKNTNLGTLTGSMAQQSQQLQQLAADYGFPNWNGSDIARNARDIVDGTTTIDTFVSRLRSYAKSAFPSFAKEIDGGQTVAQIAQPYISTASSMLERDPSQFDVRSPLIMKGLQGGQTKPGENPTAMPLWAFENTIRSDPRWDLTNNAKSEAAQLLTGLGQAWGFHV